MKEDPNKEDAVNSPASHPSPGPMGGIAYETKDVNPYYVGLFGLGLFAMIGIVLVILAGVFHRFEAKAERADPPQSPVAGPQTPPAPRLQVEPEADMAKLRHDDRQVLTTYGWIDRQKQTVRIPVERAIDILAERGFPEPEDQSPEKPQEQATVASEGRPPGQIKGQPQSGPSGQSQEAHLPAQPEERAR